MAKYICQLRRGIKDDSVGRNDWAEYEAKADHIKPLEGELVLEYDNGVPRMKIGDGIHEFSELAYMGIDSFVMPTPIYITLYADKWQQVSDKRYCQEVSVKNAIITPHSKIDLQPSSEQLAIFHEKDIAFVTENEDGVVSVFCIGHIPTNDYVIQATVMEVATNG